MNTFVDLRGNHVEVRNDVDDGVPYEIMATLLITAEHADGMYWKC